MAMQPPSSKALIAPSAASGPPPFSNSQARLFIGSLSSLTTDGLCNSPFLSAFHCSFLFLNSDSLRRFFEQFGEVKDCKVMREKKTNLSREFGFVSFRDPELCKKVLSQPNHLLLDGKKVWKIEACIAINTFEASANLSRSKFDSRCQRMKSPHTEKKLHAIVFSPSSSLLFLRACQSRLIVLFARYFCGRSS